MLLAKALRDIPESSYDRKIVLAQNLKLAEKLTKTHLRIEFLIACRSSNLKPRFIQDSLKTVRKTFSGLRKFDEKCSDFAKFCQVKRSLYIKKFRSLQGTDLHRDQVSQQARS